MRTFFLRDVLNAVPVPTGQKVIRVVQSAADVLRRGERRGKCVVVMKRCLVRDIDSDFIIVSLCVVGVHQQPA